VALPENVQGASVGVPAAAERVIGRCESCGVALEPGPEIDLAAEWRAVAPGDDGRISVPNRVSLQAAIGVEGWAGFDRSPGSLMLTSRSLELLAEHNGHRLESVRTPVTRRAQGWMWQTLVNGLTFHSNFARDLRAGRMRPQTSRGPVLFAIDCVVTVLAAPLVALVSVPLELAAVALRRGGELTAVARTGASP
jgi:hypothetical protein